MRRTPYKTQQSTPMNSWCWNKHGVHEPRAGGSRLVQPCSLRWPNSYKYTALITTTSNYMKTSTKGTTDPEGGAS